MSTSSGYSTDAETSTQKSSKKDDYAEFVSRLGLVVLAEKDKSSPFSSLVSPEKLTRSFCFPTKSVDAEVENPKKTTFHDWRKATRSKELTKYMNRNQTPDEELELARQKIDSSLSAYIKKHHTSQENSSKAYFSRFTKTLELSNRVRPQRLILVTDKQLFYDLKNVAKTGRPLSHTKSKNSSASGSSQE